VKLPVGAHNGHDNDGLLTENAKPASHVDLPRQQFCLEPGVDGGIETQLASNGSTAFAAVNDLPAPICRTGIGCSISVSAAIEAAFKGTGEMVAVNQDTGQVDWGHQAPVLALRRRHRDQRRRVHHYLPRRPVRAQRGHRRDPAEDHAARRDERPRHRRRRLRHRRSRRPLSAAQRPQIIVYKLGAS
jgi:hypothetical protein